MEKGMNFFLNRYKQLGERVKSVPLRQSFRVNTLNISENALIFRLKSLGVAVSKIDFAKHGYYIDKSRFSLGAITEYLLGYYYLQGAASQIPVEVLSPEQNELILDCCAAPGGKTSQISQWMDNKGIVIALEKQKHRLPALKNNLERMGCQNTIVFHMDALKSDKLNLKFDKILLDAPCSGNFITEPDWFEKHRNINTIKNRAELQRDLLTVCMKVLKKDGILVYSTCSLEPEENELNMQWLLDNFNVKFEKINTIGDQGLTNIFGQKLDKQIQNCKRFWPHKTLTEGFFIAKVRKL
ncbi:RsmB/NOP family class I SAM-dependent RNA methyltransferase [Candidatus Woesearchaeota archaeon]|nr:RsmB/NOP family class I SAM-dependent RNA methyltransferase [Candidatus Woesearchaeota archaeon]